MKRILSWSLLREAKASKMVLYILLVLLVVYIISFLNFMHEGGYQYHGSWGSTGGQHVSMREKGRLLQKNGKMWGF